MCLLPLLSSMEGPFSALRDASEKVALITTRVSSAPLRLQISRWYFQFVWDTGLLELPQLHFDGLLRSSFMRQFLQGILHLLDAIVTSFLPIAQLTSMAVDLAQDPYGTRCLVPRSIHSLDFPCLLVQMHMAYLVLQIWLSSDGLAASLVSGASYLHDTPLVHPGSFLTCDASVFMRFLRSLFFSACLGPYSSSARRSLSLYSFSLIQQFLRDLSTIIPLSSAEGVAVAISSLSLRVDSFDDRRSFFRSSDSFWSNLHQFQVPFVFDRGRLQVSFCSPGGCFFWFCSLATLGVCFFTRI